MKKKKRTLKNLGPYFNSRAWALYSRQVAYFLECHHGGVCGWGFRNSGADVRSLSLPTGKAL